MENAYGEVGEYLRVGGVNVYGGECLQGGGEYFWGIFMRRW